MGTASSQVGVLLIKAVCEGNELYDQLYADTAVYLDVEDVVNTIGAECNIQAISPLFGFTDALSTVH